MKCTWSMTAGDARKLKAWIGHMSQSVRYKERLADQSKKRRRRVVRAAFWQAMVAAQMTSAQRSGCHSPVSRFMRTSPFPLAYETARAQHGVRRFMATTLLRHGGIRFHTKIATQLTTILNGLEAGGWSATLAQCERLRGTASAATEREVAHYLADTFVGIGPKQSRNLLQNLGLIQFEIPIDTGVLDWLADFGMKCIGGTRALQDQAFYEFLLDGVQTLCAKAGVRPTQLDAAIFIERDELLNG